MPDHQWRRAPIALALGTIASGAAAWLVLRGRQGGIDARTRARLAPPPAAPRVPSAADIHVG